MKMKNVNIILSREYLTRVKKKSFLLTTFLVPMLFAAMCILPSVIMFMNSCISLPIPPSVIDMALDFIAEAITSFKIYFPIFKSFIFIWPFKSVMYLSINSFFSLYNSNSIPPKVFLHFLFYADFL